MANVRELLGDKLYDSLAGLVDLYAVGKFREWVLDPGGKPKPPFELLFIVDGATYPSGTIDLAGGGTLIIRPRREAGAPRFNLWTQHDTAYVRPKTPQELPYDVNYVRVRDPKFLVPHGADVKTEWLKQFGGQHPNGTHVYISGGTAFYVGGERHWWVVGHVRPVADSKLQTLPAGEYYKASVDRPEAKSERFTVGRKVNAWWAGTYGEKGSVQIWATTDYGTPANTSAAEAALYAAGIPRPANSAGVYLSLIPEGPKSDNVPPVSDDRPTTLDPVKYVSSMFFIPPRFW